LVEGCLSNANPCLPFERNGMLGWTTDELEGWTGKWVEVRDGDGYRRGEGLWRRVEWVWRSEGVGYGCCGRVHLYMYMKQ
jgi:hypothetical protein